MREAGFDFARVWRVAAYALAAATLPLLYLRHVEAAFVTAALAASAWFLNMRTGIKRKHDLVKDGPRNWRPRAEVEARRMKEEEEEG
ncbi:MAG TPA: hypothetical protein VN282_20935 [Pyrinomonadaceae bacterium]|nr:hypothetical protein [Pyrinomonadaceae bacterium]